MRVGIEVKVKVEVGKEMEVEVGSNRQPGIDSTNIEWARS